MSAGLLWGQFDFTKHFHFNKMFLDVRCHDSGSLTQCFVFSSFGIVNYSLFWVMRNGLCSSVLFICFGLAASMSCSHSHIVFHVISSLYRPPPVYLLFCLLVSSMSSLSCLHFSLCFVCVKLMCLSLSVFVLPRLLWYSRVSCASCSALPSLSCYAWFFPAVCPSCFHSLITLLCVFPSFLYLLLSFQD